MDLEFKSISQENFKKSKDSYNQIMKDFKKVQIDFYGNIIALDLAVLSDCKEICETYLIEVNSKKRMLLPSDFDIGVQGIFFSPSGNRLIIYSSYDGPDYDNYYNHRAEFHIYNINKQKGLKALELYGHYYINDCSIKNIVWFKNNNTIALKTYEGQRSNNRIQNEYVYFKTKLK